MVVAHFVFVASNTSKRFFIKNLNFSFVVVKKKYYTFLKSPLEFQVFSDIDTLQQTLDFILFHFLFSIGFISLCII